MHAVKKKLVAVKKVKTNVYAEKSVIFSVIKCISGKINKIFPRSSIQVCSVVISKSESCALCNWNSRSDIILFTQISLILWSKWIQWICRRIAQSNGRFCYFCCLRRRRRSTGPPRRKSTPWTTSIETKELGEWLYHNASNTPLHLNYSNDVLDPISYFFSVE